MSETDRPSDLELVAYLDGELSDGDRRDIERLLAGDPEARRRLEALSIDALPVAAAFDDLLDEAPAARLQAMLAGLDGRPAGDRSAPGHRRQGWWLAPIAAGLVLFVAGIAVGHLVVPRGERTQSAISEHPAEPADAWRAVVAEYLTLYTADTLASLSDDPAARRQELAKVSEALGLGLTPEGVALPELRYQRALLYAYDDRPLAQLAYLDPETGPVSLCIIAGGAGPTPLHSEVRSGLNIIYWASRDHRFMLIGRAASDRLEPLAATLKTRIAA